MIDSIKQAKILLCDDDSNNLDVVLEYFKDKPDQVLYAPNGKIGCQIAKEERPDIIIMDWSMPVMDGMQAIQVLRGQEETKYIPVIVGTGVMTSSEDLRKALNGGAIDYIRKPFDRIELTARVNSALSLSASFKKIKEQNEEITLLMEKEKELMKEALERKERELTMTTMYTFQKNEILNEILDKIKSTEEKDALIIANQLRDIKHRIKSHLDLDKMWDTLRVHFENVHPGFFEKLKTSHVELTPNDLKMCAYLKIGVGNKEIAQLTNTTPATIKKSLNRLKKKLNLTAEDSLRDFILAF